MQVGSLPLVSAGKPKEKVVYLISVPLEPVIIGPNT